MTEIAIADYPQAVPLTDTGVEMATGSLKIVVARSGSFKIAGVERTAFVVGSRMTPVPVAYSGNPNCYECSVLPWMVRALFDVPAAELEGAVFDLSDLPNSLFRHALEAGEPDPLSVARIALWNWSAGRGTADARITSAVWSALQLDPTRPITNIAAFLNIGTRRVRQAIQQETGLSSANIRRLVRHEKALVEFADRRKTLAQVAYDAGYADQSHMTREMITLGGITPLRLRESMVPG